MTPPAIQRARRGRTWPYRALRNECGTWRIENVTTGRLVGADDEEGEWRTRAEARVAAAYCARAAARRKKGKTAK